MHPTVLQFLIHAIMTTPWSAGWVAPKIVTKHLLLHYSRNPRNSRHWGYYGCSSQPGAQMVLAYTACHVRYQICHRWSLALECEEGLERRGPYLWCQRMRPVCRWPARQREAHGELLYDIAWCWQPHRMGHGEHPNFKIDMNGWMVMRTNITDGHLMCSWFLYHWQQQHCKSMLTKKQKKT